MGCECASYVGRACRDHVPSRCDGALEVWAGARSRCHHTFAGMTAGLSSVRRTHGPRGAPGPVPAGRGFVRPHGGRAKSYGAGPAPANPETVARDGPVVEQPAPPRGRGVSPG